MTGPNSAELDAWLKDYVARASQPDYADNFMHRINDAILARVPQVRDDPLLVEDLDASTRAHWLGFLETLTRPELTLVFPEPAAEFARSVARRGHELRVLLKVYRQGNLTLWEHFTEVIDDLPANGPTRDETLVYLWTRGGAWLDESIERITEIYSEVQAQALETRIAGKMDTIRALLEGHPPADDASGSLRHALNQWQTAFVVWVQPGTEEASRVMQDAARAFATTLGAPPPLTIPRSGRDLWCWAATPKAPKLEAALESLDRDEHPDVQLAIGMPARGVAGFRASNQEARDVQRLIMSVPEPPRIVRYDEVELLCLAHAESESFRRMVLRELGPLTGDASGIEHTRATLLCYLTNGANVEAVASELFVHRNTVRYRLNRAEELMGHRITERIGHVELALRYLDLFGGVDDPDELTHAAPRRRSPAAPAN
ncbi:MAG TPA: helix-turn-helix domain-containing protein [Aldersonia sp.]